MMLYLSGRARGLLMLVVLVALLITAHPAFAQTVTTVDVSPILPWFDMIVHNGLNFILVGIGGLLARYVRNEMIRRALMDAIVRAADGAYAEIVAAGATYADIPIRNVAIANAVNYIIPRFKLAMAVFGLTPDSVGEMIHKQLGASLVADPTVSIAPQPALPVPIIAAPATPPAALAAAAVV